MTKADLVEQVAGAIGRRVTKRECGLVVDAFLDAVREALARGEGIELRGFGTFKVQHRKARTALNPTTGGTVEVAAYDVPVFQPSKLLRNRVDQGSGRSRENPWGPLASHSRVARPPDAARFILHLGEVSGEILVLLRMGGIRLVASADNVADGGSGGTRLRPSARRAVWPSRTGLLDRSDLPRRAAWACPMPNSPMARQASRVGGRFGHGRALPRAMNAPAVMAQPQGGQRYTEPARCPVKGTVLVRPPSMSTGHPPYGLGDAGSGLKTRCGSGHPEVGRGSRSERAASPLPGPCRSSMGTHSWIDIALCRHGSRRERRRAEDAQFLYLGIKDGEASAYQCHEALQIAERVRSGAIEGADAKILDQRPGRTRWPPGRS
jgi:nucleoid DNA-binding protein